MTLDTVKVNLILQPCIAIGAVLGIFVLKKMPEKAFAVTVRVLVIIAAVRLLF